MQAIPVRGADPRRPPESWRRLLDAVPVAVVIVAPDGTICFGNAEFERVTGHAAADVEGRPVELLVPEGQRADHTVARLAYDRAPSRRPMGTGLDIAFRRADGSVFPADVSLSPLEIGGETFVVATIADETEHRRSAEELFYRAVHDPLTGLANRVLLVDRLEHALARADRQTERLAVLYVDLDGFKAVNDTWGHGVGDAVLRSVAARLDGAVRPEDTVARFGGDEFVILCEDLNDSTDAVRVARRVLREVRRPVRHQAGTSRLTASIGVVLSDGPASAAALIEAADDAMYRAKHRGGGALELDHAPVAVTSPRRGSGGRRGAEG